MPIPMVFVKVAQQRHLLVLCVHHQCHLLQQEANGVLDVSLISIGTLQNLVIHSLDAYWLALSISS
jgi:hypothetical protein